MVRLAERRGAAPSTMNRRIAAVRGLFEFAVMSGVRAVNPVPTAPSAQRSAREPAGLLGLALTCHHQDPKTSTGSPDTPEQTATLDPTPRAG